VLDHAVIVPTRYGPVGATVSEPKTDQRGALILLQGGGPPCRPGTNAFCTHLAHDFAALGLVVLRFDFACEGDSTMVGRDVPREGGWRRTIDLYLLRCLAPWFRERTGESELLIAGICYGARLGLEFAVTDAAAMGLFMVVPYLQHREPHLLTAEERDLPPSLNGRAWSGGATIDNDGDLVEGFRACLARGPVWVLAGDGEDLPVRPLERRFAGSSRPLELDLVSGIPLHPVIHPAQQATVRHRLVGRVARAVEESDGQSVAGRFSPSTPSA
jgi:hypothetical protein